MRGHLATMRILITGRKKKTIGLLASCLFFVFLTGCGKDFLDSNTLEFNRDGSITEYMAEEFDTSEYSLEEWENDVNSEIDEYNSSKGKKEVKLLGKKHENGILKCIVKYASDNAYFDLNKLPLFYGTIDQAITAGYSLMTPLKSVETGEPISSADLQKMKSAHIVILKGDMDISTCKKITYISDGVTMGDEDKRATISTDNTVYIVFD